MMFNDKRAQRLLTTLDEWVRDYFLDKDVSSTYIEDVLTDNRKMLLLTVMLYRLDMGEFSISSAPKAGIFICGESW